MDVLTVLSAPKVQSTSRSVQFSMQLAAQLPSRLTQDLNYSFNETTSLYSGHQATEPSSSTNSPFAKHVTRDFRCPRGILGGKFLIRAPPTCNPCTLVPKMVSLLVLALLFLFAFVDAWYFLRLLSTLLPCWIRQRLSGDGKRMSRSELLAPSTVQGVVLPFDLDLQLHMNNSKYLREMDFGRIRHILSTNFYRHLTRLGGSLVVGATMIRYRRSLQLWQRFTLQTQILCWVGDAMYVEQRFVSSKDGFVCAIALLRMCTRGVLVEKVMERLCMDGHQSPPFPPHVESWAETIDRSKQYLKGEREL